jgi:hypothetical protein
MRTNLRDGKSERTCGTLKTAIAHELRVLIRDCEDDHLDLAHSQGLLCCTEDCPSLQCLSHPPIHPEGQLRVPRLINKVDEQIRIIKLLSPSSFTLDNFYDDELAGCYGHHQSAPPHPFDDVVQTISVLDRFDKLSVIQLLRNMGSDLLQPFWHFICLLCIISTLQIAFQSVLPSTVHSLHPSPPLLTHITVPQVVPNATSALTLAM